jgi:hypothetical protein
VPAAAAASEVSTFTGDPVRARIEPACAAKTIGIKSCEGERLSCTAITTTTGSSAATEPFRLMSAVSDEHSSMMSMIWRTRLSPAFSISSCPAQAVTPVTSSPALTTNSEAMKIVVESPSPARA